MKALFKKITDIINGLAIIGLLLAYLSSYVDPQDFWPFAFFGLTFKFWLVLNVFLALWWLLLKKKRWLYNTLVIAIGFQFIARDIQFDKSKKSVADFKICSFNTKVQHVYAGGNTSSEINNYLVNNKYDVAVLIEWFNKKGKIDESAFPHQQFVNLKAKRNKYDYGLKLVSKHKILNWERVKYNHFTNNMAAYFDIDINGETIRFVAVHLASNSLSARDYHKMIKVEADEKYKKYALDVVSRIKRGLLRRSKQASSILEAIADSPHPVVILGDFNDTPQSYAYQQLRNGRKDAFIEAGSGTGATFLKPFPLLRIDYILYDKQLECTNYASSQSIQSDHKLVEASFKF